MAAIAVSGVPMLVNCGNWRRRTRKRPKDTISAIERPPISKRSNLNLTPNS